MLFLNNRFLRLQKKKNMFLFVQRCVTKSEAAYIKYIVSIHRNMLCSRKALFLKHVLYKKHFLQKNKLKNVFFKKACSGCPLAKHHGAITTIVFWEANWESPVRQRSRSAILNYALNLNYWSYAKSVRATVWALIHLSFQLR